MYALGSISPLVKGLRAYERDGKDVVNPDHLLSQARDYRARLLALAPYFENEFWDGDSVCQISIDTVGRNAAPLFPPPLSRNSSTSTFSTDHSLDHASYEYQQKEENGNTERPIPSCVWYSDRLVARRHLLFYSCMMLSNLLLSRLDSRLDGDAMEDRSNDTELHADLEDYRRKANAKPLYKVHTDKSRSCPRFLKPLVGVDVGSQMVRDVEKMRVNTPNPDLEHIAADSWSDGGCTAEGYNFLASKQTHDNHFTLAPLLPQELPRSIPLSIENYGNSGLESLTAPCIEISDIRETACSLSENAYADAGPEFQAFASFGEGFQYDVDSMSPTIHDYFLDINNPYFPSDPPDFANHLTIEANPTLSDFEYLPTQNITPFFDVTPPDLFTSLTIDPKVQNTHLLSLVLRSYPYAAREAPLGAVYYMFPLQMASAISTTPQKEWIANALNDLFKDMGMSFTVRKLELVMGIFTGRF
ncbi:MAG: hypothetical protein Q9227_008143 [Pyrenula ochraceoflavens]